VDKPHKKLEVWKRSMDFVIAAYDLTKRFPREEQYGLSDQIRRSAVSVPANIAEGAGRRTKKEFLNFLHISQGSLSELDTHLEIALRLDYLDSDIYEKLDNEITLIDKMLTGLIKSQRPM
jgi:four helix bundle protein